MSVKPIMELASKHGAAVFLTCAFLGFLLYTGRQEATDREQTRQHVMDMQEAFMGRLKARDEQARALADSGHAAVEVVAESVASMSASVNELSRQMAAQNELLRRMESK